MDGNGRWARARGLPRVAGHRAGARLPAELAAQLGHALIALARKTGRPAQQHGAARRRHGEEIERSEKRAGQEARQEPGEIGEATFRAEGDRLGPGLDLAALDLLFLVAGEQDELIAQQLDILVQLPGQFLKLGFAFALRQLDDRSEGAIFFLT